MNNFVRIRYFKPIFRKFKYEFKHTISNCVSKWVKIEYRLNRFEKCGNRTDYLPDFLKN